MAKYKVGDIVTVRSDLEKQCTVEMMLLARC